MACAQCHTHKFDPIQQTEYYQFMAFLNNADEPTLECHSGPSLSNAVAATADRGSQAGLVDRFPVELN
jgi:hypothetical protein